MIEHNSKKVKGIIKRTVNSLPGSLGLPKIKFLYEMVGGVIASGSMMLSDIGRALKERIDIKHTEKRLQRNVSRSGEVLEYCNQMGLEAAGKRIKPDTYLYIDGGDLTYSQAESYEKMGHVHDGSTGKIKMGYPLNMAVYKNERGEVIPVYLEMFHRQDGYLSDNVQTLGLIERLMRECKGKGIFVMDRGYDSKRVMRYIMDRGGRFIIRQTGRRDLYVGDKKVSASELSDAINCRYEHRNGRYGYKKCYLENYPVTLILYRRGKQSMMLLCSGHISRSREAAASINGYFNRWGIEEGYKFIKQRFGIEKALVKKVESIKCLLGVIHLAWRVLAEIAEDEELKYEIERKARIIDRKGVKFLYYRIAKGVSAIFSLCKEFYRFRRKGRKVHVQPTIEDFLGLEPKFTVRV
jgi:hypothetical protein